MTLIPFVNDNLWGVKEERGKIILPAIYDEVSIFVFKSDCLIDSLDKKRILDGYRSQISLSEIAKRRGNPIIDKIEAAEKIIVESDSSFVFLVKHGNEFFLLKRKFNLFNHRWGIQNVYNEFETLESFKLSPKKGKNISKYPDQEPDVVTMGQFYDKIVHIGKGLFKVEIVDVTKVEEVIDEDQNTAWRYHFSTFMWKILDHSGNPKFEKSFSDVDSFNDNLCMVKRGGKWNFIDENAKLILDDWYYHLEYPVFDNNHFLAGRKTYFIGIGLENEATIFQTTDFCKEDDIIYSDEVYLKRIQGFTGKELEDFIRRLLGKTASSVTVEETTLLDLYNSKGLVSKLGISDLRPLNDDLFAAKIKRDFFLDFDYKGQKKIIQHNSSSLVLRGHGYGFNFIHERILDQNGNFIGNSCYEQINDFKGGLAVVSKGYFKMTSGNEIEYFESVKDERFYSGTIDYCVKYGAIDSSGREVHECKYEEDELYALI